MDRLALLSKVPLFQGLSPADLEKLARALVERRVAAGEPVFAQGASGDRMYIVAKGRAQVFLPKDDNVLGRDLTLTEFGPGDHFGELALFDAQPRSASVSCIEESVLLELSREAFIADVMRSAEAVLVVLRAMAERLRRTNTLLSSHAAKDAVRELSENLSWAERLADRVAGLNGSWTFILFLVGLSIAWSLANALLARPFDGYPYVFFNLLLGLLVALQGPLIVMSQNRQAAADRAQAASDFKVNLKNELGIESLLREVALLRHDTSRRLVALEERRAED